ncbi:hypothetical protein EBZ39_13700 [bacterium]|nr:hypothetical protein [bacterium]
MKTEYPCLIKKKVSDLMPSDYNPRTITDEAIGRLTKSLAELGNLQPITWNARTGRIVGGHQRLKCYQAMGKKEVEVWAVDLSEDKEKAANLALNKLAGEFDPLRLKDLVEQLDTGGMDLEITGFSMEELGEMMSMAPPEIVEDEVPEPPADPVTKQGDLWILGEHQLLCGDSTKTENIKNLFNGKNCEAVITDPPYGTGIVASSGLGNSKVPMNLLGDHDTSLARAAFKTWQPFAGVQIWWGANYYSDVLPGSSSWAVWDKDHHGMTFADAELAYVSTGGPTRVFRHAWSGNHRASEQNTKREHPTQKPVALYSWIFNTWASNLVLIADPFLGSGTTLIAAEQLGRKCYGMEISPAYCDVIVKRWETLTGKKAKLCKS